VLWGGVGIGKTALAAAAVSEELSRPGLMWSFAEDASPASFLNALHDQLPGLYNGLGLDRIPRFVETLDDFVIVVDGLEHVQNAQGEVEDPALAEILEALTRPTKRSSPPDGSPDDRGPARITIVTTRVPLRLGDRAVMHVPVPPLASSAADTFLTTLGVAAPLEQRVALATVCGRRPLALRLVAGAVRTFVFDTLRILEPSDKEADDPENRTRLILGGVAPRLSPADRALLGVVGLFPAAVSPSFTLVHILNQSLEAVNAAVARLLGLGLLYRETPATVNAHAAVKAYFVASESNDPGLRTQVARFLTRPGARLDAKSAAAAVHHYRVDGRFTEAAAVYWDRLEPELRARRDPPVEAMVRELLTALPGEHRAAWRGRLLDELASILAERGQVEEASSYSLRALREHMRGDDREAVRRTLIVLGENALLRGRLPLAAKCAARALALGDEGLGGRLRDVAAFYRHATLPTDLEAWIEEQPVGKAAIWLCDILNSIGRYADACFLALQISGDSAGSHRSVAVLQATVAAFWKLAGEVPLNAPSESDVAASQLRRPTRRRSVVELASETSVCSPLLDTLREARARGHVPMLCRALLFQATTFRLARRHRAAIAVLEEAEALARRWGLGLALVNALIVRAMVEAESGNTNPSEYIGEAVGLSSDPRIDYVWGRQRAHELAYALLSPGPSGSSAEAEEGESATVSPQRVPGTDRGPRIGEGELGAWVAVQAGDGAVLTVPVERDVGARLVGTISHDSVFGMLWDALYQAHQAAPDRVGPFYHLLVLLAIDRVWTHVGVGGEDLWARGRREIGASLFAVAHGATPEAIRRLSVAVRGEGGTAVQRLARAAAAYNLGVLEMRRGHVDAAVDAFDRARHLDWTFLPARQAPRRPDVQVEIRDRCQTRLEQTLGALDRWRRGSAGGAYPMALEMLVPGWISMLPSCPGVDGEAYGYLRARSGGRCLLRCPVHRIRLDSSLGLLTPAAHSVRFEPLTPTSTAHPEGVLNLATLCLSSERVLKIVEREFP
jgi:hypothetical protein